MIKRRFYRIEHGSRDAPSESSSSSDSEVEAEASDDTEVEEEEEEDDVVADDREKEEALPSSGYESEDSSVNEVNLDSSGIPASDDDVAAQNGGQDVVHNLSSRQDNAVFVGTDHNPEKDEIGFDVTDCVIKCKSVFKCRLCPRIVCLSEETIKAHLNSKRHARSVKLHKEGRLKLMLKDDGKIEGETHPEKPSTNTVSGQRSAKSKGKGKGRWKHGKKLKQETRRDKAGLLGKNREKRRRKDDS